MPRIARIAVLNWIALLLAPLSAGALSFDLEVVLADGTTGDFATVEVEEVGGDLRFEIEVREEHQSEVHVRELYFNTLWEYPDLSISESNGSYTLRSNPEVVAGDGAEFDWAVDFREGPMAEPWNVFAFTLSSSDELDEMDLLESSFTDGGLEIQVGLNVLRESAWNIQDGDWDHIHGPSCGHFGGDPWRDRDPTPETWGNPIPEPGTGVLMLAGLLGLAFVGRRRL